MQRVKPFIISLFSFVALFMLGCQHQLEIPSWAQELDENGLRNGEVAQDFEFCFKPDADHFSRLVEVYPNLQQPIKSHGRSQCVDEEWLVIGNSHLENFHQHFAQLQQLVGKITPTHWE